MNHRLRVKWSEILFFSATVIFEKITLVMSHLNYDDKKSVQFLYCEISRLLCGLSGFIYGGNILVEILVLFLLVILQEPPGRKKIIVNGEDSAEMIP